MAYVRKIKLIPQTVTYGPRHAPIYTDGKAREVFAEIQSVKRAEFFQASTAGMTAEGTAIVWAFEYHNESVLQLDNQRYAIYRTFKPEGNKIELYYGYEVGTNTAAPAPEVTT